jgi:hypothetical protein
LETIGGNNARGITKAAVTAAAADTIIGVTAALLTTADARWGGWHGGGWHGGGWHVGGWRSGGWGWGFAPGFALGLGLGAAPYYAYGGPYYGAYAYVRDAPAGRDQPLGSSRMEMGARLLLNISTD